MEAILLNDLIIIFGLSIAILYISHKLKLSIIVGFLFTGILVGPYGMGLIAAVEEVELLAEIGIILLLFSIGVELSIKDLWKLKRMVFVGGFLQVFITCAVTFIASVYLGYSYNEAIFLGFLISLSSTAIVLKIMQNRAELHSLHGKNILSILLFQDVIVVAMIVATPILAGTGESGIGAILEIVAMALGIIVFVLVAARWVVPYLLFQITKTRNPELFLLSIIVICLAVALLTASIGLSLALGAFLAGLIISESEYSHQALGNILPFRDIFLSFFFVSVGMLLDISFFLERPLMMISLAALVMLGKSFISGFVSSMMGYPMRTSVLTGIALSQVGEFSFVLSKFGLDAGILDSHTYQIFLDISILTMAATSVAIAISPQVADNVVKLPIPKRLKKGMLSNKLSFLPDRNVQLNGHLIIVGFGFNGHTVAKAAKAAGIPYVVIESNPQSVRDGLEEGHLIFYGDASQESVLEHASINTAKAMVIGISDAPGTRRTTWMARSMNPNIHIIARTRYLQEVEPLYELGANEVIPEEFETSVEIFVRLLRRYLVPEDQIKQFIADVRSDSYEMLRSISPEHFSLADMQFDIPDVDIISLRVPLESEVVGKTLKELDLRRNLGITVLAIRRGLNVMTSPDGDVKLLEGDILVLMGKHEEMEQLGDLFVNININDG
ncbi:CPA2 family monovalent cation:H+ antiporter-2 [Methanohalophilus levihalophilus]|uniref:cation:proton antiporter domain-containing protein n=1 Tax=Methanohalophilus levihalophilus TaxID=1431282 RepID=UPI001AEA3A43|nr:cation:proton antiporter [Methanohalophilus levihalophilus]MBP2030775.1 CPA2 family monovalent cation:H+ antiporter-2 [Methanohalophilus levihalophilus]